MCYLLYRWVFQCLTGKSLRFGNFSVVPGNYVVQLSLMPELSINFAAALIKSRLPIVGVNCDRGPRYDGVTSQNFVGLIIHALNGITVFSDIALVRVSLFSGALIMLTLVSMAILAGIRVFTDLAIVGWASNVFGVLLILMFQSLLLSLVAAFVRGMQPRSPVADPNAYRVAVTSVTRLGHESDRARMQ